jgi:hypothetical protein
MRPTRPGVSPRSTIAFIVLSIRCKPAAENPARLCDFASTDAARALTDGKKLANAPKARQRPMHSRRPIRSIPAFIMVFPPQESSNSHNLLIGMR